VGERQQRMASRYGVGGAILGRWLMAALLLSLAAPVALADAPSHDIASTPIQPLRTAYNASEHPRSPVSVLTPPAGSLCPQFWGLGVLAGFTVEEMVTVDELMWRESRCQPAAWNKEDPGTGSRGLVQINSSWHGWLKRQGIPIDRPADLFKPAVNMAAARAIFNYSVTTHGYKHRFSAWRL